MIEIRNFIAFRGKKSNMKGSDEGLTLETSIICKRKLLRLIDNHFT